MLQKLFAAVVLLLKIAWNGRSKQVRTLASGVA
jgi:hypothetical protein